MQHATGSNSLLIKESDYRSLTEFIKRNRSDAASALQREISRADMVEDSHFPDDVVGMNSAVSFLDRDIGQQTKVTLVLPWQANMTKKKISVLSPLGCALIGLKSGDRIDWPLLDGQARRLEIISVSQDAQKKLASA
jgi:regulator of nucleoside diphosphate kinase